MRIAIALFLLPINEYMMIKERDFSFCSVLSVVCYCDLVRSDACIVWSVSLHGMHFTRWRSGNS